MKKLGWTKITVVLAFVAIGCWLAQLPLWAISPTDYPGYIPGGYAKIPRAVLKRIRTIRPGMTREKFYKLFVSYTPGVTVADRIKGGKSTRIFHYVYRFAYVPPVYTKDIDKPDTTHWEFKKIGSTMVVHVGAHQGEEPTEITKLYEPMAGTLILVDVTWTFVDPMWAHIRAGITGSSEADIVGNSDDVITHVSKPYLIFDGGTHV